MFPRLIGRGPIEAFDVHHFPTFSYPFPRLIGRGPIEAILLLGELLFLYPFPRLIGRGPIEAYLTDTTTREVDCFHV